MRLLPEMRSIPLRDRGMYSMMFMLEHYFRSSQTLKQRKAKLCDRIAGDLRRKGPGKIVSVERVTKLTPEAFRRDYLAHGIPVIIDKAAASWICTREWSFANFRRRFGDETIKLVQRKGLSDDDFVDEREFSEELKFSEFLDQVEGGTMKYMRFSPLLERFPELLTDFDKQFLKDMPGKLSLGITYHAFIGGTGTFTPLHNAPVPFLFVNICGIKRWALIPNHYLPTLNPAADGMGYNHSGADVNHPDAEGFPGFDAIDRLEAVMEPGDVLFVPSWMWHCVQNELPTIGVRCGFIYPKSMLTESMMLTMIRVFAARNPTIWEGLYYAFLRRDLPSRDKMLLAAKIFRD